MKICLIADTHIHPFQAFADGTGANNSRVQISLDALEQVKQFCIHEGIKQLWHLGDVFHARDHQRYPVFNVVHDKLKEISRHLELHFIVGNHDIVDKQGTLTIHAFRDFAEVHDKPDTIGNDIFVVPYTTDYDRLIAEQLPSNSRFVREEASRRCCLGHLDVKGARPGSSLFALENGIDPSVLEPFKATVLGHYHIHQSVGTACVTKFVDQSETPAGNIYYVGALTPVDFGEVDQPGSFCTLDTETGEVNHKHIQCPRFVKLDQNAVTSDGLIAPAIASQLKGNFVRLDCEQTDKLNDQLIQIGVAAAEFVPQAREISSASRIENVSDLNWQELIDQYISKVDPGDLDSKELAAIGMELLT